MHALLLLALQAVSPSVLEGEGAPWGETVASVRIDAPATARLERYVEVTEGKPLRAEDIRHAVELLHATGQFEDVVVEVERVDAGVGVVFRPSPAPRLDRIRVVGDSLLSPRRLRKITRLRDREPLWPPRLERAGRDAAVALTEKGYLEARVSVEARRHGRGADAVFVIQAGRPSRVASSRVLSDDPRWGDLLRADMRPRPGDVFERRRATAAAQRMRDRLVEYGHWKATVTHRDSYDPGSARTDLVFDVTVGPLTMVDIQGAPTSASLRRSIQKLLREGALRSDVLEEAAERVETDFKRRGYRDVLVSVHEAGAGPSHSTVYEIQPGPKFDVASVRIVGGPHEGLDGLLLTRAGSPLQDKVLEEDVSRLTRTLENQGHADAKVDTEFSEVGGLVPVTFRVRAGPRTLIADSSIVSEAAPVGEDAPRELRLRPGRPYRIRDLAADRNDVQAAYRNAGYLRAEVSPEVVFSEDKTEARIVLRVDPGPRTYVDHIVVAGLGNTREAVVRRELRISENGPLGVQNVLESQRRLGSLGIFQRVDITEMDPESIDRRSLVVSAEEAQRTTLAYAFGYAERDRLRASLEVSRRNLFGMDRSLSSFLRYSLRGNRVLATFREPYLLGRKQELFVTGFREREDRAAFDFVRFGTLLQTARALSPRWSLVLRYTFQRTETSDLKVPLVEVERQFQSSIFSGPSASLVNDSRDDPIDPRRGHLIGADVQFSHAVLGGDSFVKGFLQAAAYRRLSAGVVVALAGRVGLARTFVDQPRVRLPPPDRFFAGGDYSLRGFEVDTAGPLERSPTGRLLPTGGNALLLGGAELRIHAAKGFSVAVFSEAGNVFPLVSDLRLSQIRYTAGLGLRYKSAFGPLRIDWGYKLNRRPDEDPYRWHFTIGHAF